MSGVTEGELERLHLRQIIADIDQKRAETQKFAAEQMKLSAEANKFNRERWLILVGAAGGVAGLIAALVTVAKALGWAAP